MRLLRPRATASTNTPTANDVTAMMLHCLPFHRFARADHPVPHLSPRIRTRYRPDAVLTGR